MVPLPRPSSPIDSLVPRLRVAPLTVRVGALVRLPFRAKVPFVRLTAEAPALPLRVELPPTVSENPVPRLAATIPLLR